MRARAWRSEDVPRLAALFTLVAFVASMAFGIVRSEAHVRSVVTTTPTPAPAVRTVPVARGGTLPALAATDILRPNRRAVTYAAAGQTALPGALAMVDVTVRNLSDRTWTAGPDGMRLSYHVYDASGGLVAWDGLRADLPSDLEPGAAIKVALPVSAPRLTGTYTVRPDLIVEGVGWSSSTDGPAGSFQLKVRAELDAGYGGTTAPVTMIPGGLVPVQVPVTNDGVFTWRAAGDHPIRLSYHWFDTSGNPVLWDGPRSALPFDVLVGEGTVVAAAVRAPEVEGDYLLVWDMVEEGKGWFSDRGVRSHTDRVTVSNDITLYGKGWGHGIGLSQWGAQGWAEGATGVRLVGEQIVTRYFPYATLGTQPPSKPFRVLISAPSTGCVGRTINSVANMSAAMGMRLVNDADPSVVYLDAAPHQPVRFTVYAGNVLVAVDVWSGRTVFAGENNALTLVPNEPWDPISIAEKGLAYRGTVQVEVRDAGMLRVVNYVGSDDYMKGSLPSEMPSTWEMEALRAQAITARTYAAWRQSTAGTRTWDVRDDTADQCYGGYWAESPRTNAAVASTPNAILTYAGKPIRALYSSANGGITENVGCVLDAERVGDTWRCAEGWPYLAVLPDPAEAVAYDRRGGMPHGLWAETFSAHQIRMLIADDYGVDIGGFVSMEFNESPGGRPISVRVRGTLAMVDVRGDRFLRTVLGLKSTLVHTRPF
jgi:peptidoglycan hydrolase-like amidase